MVKGEITVFLSLTLIVILAFLCTVAESARIYVLKTKVKNITHLAVESVFAEYNKTLLEQYDLFFYCKNTNLEHTVLEEMEDKWISYASYNENPIQGIWYLKNANFFKVELKEFDILHLQFAIEENGRPFKEQAIQFIKDKVGSILLEGAREKLLQGEQIWNQKKNTEDAKLQLEQAELEMKNSTEKEREEKKENTKNETPSISKKPIKNNPLELLKEWKQKGILELVIQDISKISDKTIDLDTVVSARERNKSLNSNQGDYMEKIYFNKYILEKCSFYTNTMENMVLDYEVEYVLNGKGSDKDNLEGTVLKLLGLREISNFTYLLSDRKKKTQAIVLATAIGGFTGMAPVIKGVQLGILLAWAFAESIGDVEILLNAGKVPMIKTKDTWRSSLENLSLKQGKEKGGKKGLIYKDYLEILLVLQKNETSLWRMLDIIEKNVQAIEKSNFKMSQAIQFVDYSAHWQAKPLFFSLPFLKKQGATHYQFFVQDYYQYITE